MKRTHIALVALTAAFALGSGDAWAQRSAGSAPVTGSAVPRGSGDSGSSPAPASSGGSTTDSSGSGTSGGSTVSGGGNPSVRTPSRSETLAYAPQRRGGGGGQSTGSRAVPRGASGGSGGSGTTSSATPSGTRSGSSTAGTRSSGGDRRAVPTYSRPREDRPVRGYATERGSVPRPPGGGGIIVYPPYYPYYGYPSYGYPYYGYGAWGLGFGLGWGLYDPFWSPYGYGYGGGGYYGGGSSYDSDMRGTGSLRLKVSPREAKVYVDGYFVGEVDEFDGTFQKLSLDAGGHTIEIKAEGFESAQLDVMITPGETVTYKGELVAIRK